MCRGWRRSASRCLALHARTTCHMPHAHAHAHAPHATRTHTHKRMRRAPASRLVSSRRSSSSSPSCCYCPTRSPPPPPAEATPRRLRRGQEVSFCVSALPNKACNTRRQRGRCHAGERTYLRCGSRLALRSLCARGGGRVRFRAVLGALLPHFVLALLLLAVRRRLLLALRRLGLLLALLSSHELRWSC